MSAHTFERRHQQSHLHHRIFTSVSSPTPGCTVANIRIHHATKHMHRISATPACYETEPAGMCILPRGGMSSIPPLSGYKLVQWSPRCHCTVSHHPTAVPTPPSPHGSAACEVQIPPRMYRDHSQSQTAVKRKPSVYTSGQNTTDQHVPKDGVVNRPALHKFMTPYQHGCPRESALEPRASPETQAVAPLPIQRRHTPTPAGSTEPRWVRGTPRESAMDEMRRQRRSQPSLAVLVLQKTGRRSGPQSAKEL